MKSEFWLLQTCESKPPRHSCESLVSGISTPSLLRDPPQAAGELSSCDAQEVALVPSPADEYDAVWQCPKPGNRKRP